MLKTREELHEKLCSILESRNCYFSPPSNIQMKYPCIRYKFDGVRTLHADNRRYFNRPSYSLIVIDENSDSDILKRLFEDEELVYLSLDDQAVADGMYNYYLTLFL